MIVLQLGAGAGEGAGAIAGDGSRSETERGRCVYNASSSRVEVGTQAAYVPEFGFSIVATAVV